MTKKSWISLLAENEISVLARILGLFWEEEHELDTNIVENIIWNLWNKMKLAPKHLTYIQTVLRAGYKIKC